MMSEKEKIAQARSLVDNPLFQEFWAEMENQAIDACVYADPTDHDKRAAFAAEARAIRNFRSKLNVIIDEANAKRKSAPA
jgi:hypothetical protein